MEDKESWKRVLDAGRLLASNLDISSLLRAITKLSAEVANAESASLLLLDPETQELYFDIGLGLKEEARKIRLKIGQGIAGSVAADKKPLLISDVHLDARWSPKMDQISGFSTRSILAVPMMRQERLLGVIEVINKKTGDFTFNDAELLEALASQAAIALENARLFASLGEERKKLDIVFVEMSDGALLTDEASHILIANRAAKKFLGGQSALNELFSQWTLFPSWPEILRRLETGPVHFTAERKEIKSLILGGLATPIRNKNSASKEKPVFLYVFRDETELRRRESIKRTFLSFISHKLKTPLSSILGFTDLLTEEFKDNARPSAILLLDSLRQQGRKLANIIDKLLRYVSLESPEDTVHFEPTFLGEVLDEALKETELLIKKNNFSVSIQKTASPSVLANSPQIKNAMVNLIENAIKFSATQSKSIAVELKEDFSQALFSVADSGPGIPPEDLDKVFDRFHQIEAYFTGQVEGLGLGLPYVKRVAQNHGGNVKIQSQIGRGTTVTLSLPLLKKKGAS